MKPDVRLHVDELVLEGIAPGDRHAIGEAVRAELARLIAERGLPPNLASADGAARLDGGRLAAAPGQPVRHVGAAVAQAVYRAGDGR